MRRGLGFLMIAGVFTASAAPAGLIEQKDGTFIVGEILQSDGKTVRLRTGREPSDEVEFKVSDIKRVLSVAEELSANLKETSPNILETRAEAYHRAGLEFDALVCLERVFAQQGRSAGSGAREGSPDWQAFRTVARISFETRRMTDAPVLLAKAREAREAGAGALSADLIQRADAAEAGAGAARNTGMELGVPVRPNHRIDLSPCAYLSSEVVSIEDEGVIVSAAADRAFLHVPIRIDRRSSLAVSKGLLRGRDARSLYGVRPMRVEDGKPIWEPGRNEPVYERLDCSASDGEMAFRNLTPPRRPPGETAPRDRTSSRDRKLPATGWAVLIFEIRRGAVSLSVQLPGESTEEVDVSLIRRAREPLPEWTDLAAGPPEPLLDVISRLERAGQAPPARRDSLTATTLLALSKLGEARSTLADRSTRPWRDLTHGAVIQAVGGGDPVIGEAAWNYLSTSAFTTSGELTQVVGMWTGAHFHWAGTIEAARPNVTGRGVQVAREALAGILEKGDATASARVLDALERLNDNDLWFALSTASIGVKKLALARMSNIPTNDENGRGAVAALVAGMQSELALPILSVTRKRGLRIASVDDPVLWQWSRMRDRTARAKYLEALVLAGSDLSGVWHSAAMSMIARDVHRSRDREILAAWNRMVAAHAGAVDRSGGMFPLLVARESSDPDLLGLNAIATHGAPEDRQSAIRELLSLGYAEEVQRALGPNVDPNWPHVLSTGAKKEHQLALLGLLARWAAGGSADLAPVAMTHAARVLADVAADRPQHAGAAAAAIKSGMTIETLNDLSWGVDPASSGAALRIAYAVGHMTQQERERVAGAADPAARLAELNAVDLRRGQLVDGGYSVLAVTETTTRVDNGTGRGFWGEPQRRLAVLSPIRLEVELSDDKITAFLNNAPIGTGRAIASDRMIKPLPYYYGVLEALDGDDYVIQPPAPTTQSFTTSRPAAVRPGPMVLPDLRPRSGEPGSLTLDIGAFAGELKAAGMPGVAWPATFPVTLRYHIFGTWVGCGRRRALPADAKDGDAHLLNIMLIVEKKD